MLRSKPFFLLKTSVFLQSFSVTVALWVASQRAVPFMLSSANVSVILSVSLSVSELTTDWVTVWPAGRCLNRLLLQSTCQTVN